MRQVGTARALEVRTLRRQGGAVAVYVAVALIAILTAVLLVIDIGRLYYAQRDLQKLATLAATSAAQSASGCAAGDGMLADLATVTAEVQSILTANRNDTTALGWLVGFNGSAPVELGRSFVGDGGIRGFEPLDSSIPEQASRINAVRVNLTRPQPNPLIPFLLGGGAGNTLKASATAEQVALGSFYVGSGVLGLDTSGSALLNPLLTGLLGSGTSLALNVADYQGLARVGVSLDLLATALDVDVQDLSSLLSTSTTLPAILNALSPLVDEAIAGGTSGTVSALLTNLAAAASGNTNEIPLGELLSTVDDVAAAVPFVNLLDLILALGQVANADASGGAEPIALPVELDVPGVASVRVFIKILEAPQFGRGKAGQAVASTANIRLLIRIEAGAILNSLAGLVNGVLNGLLSVLALVGVQTSVSVVPPPINIGIDVAVAKAKAYLDELQCPSSAVNDGMPVARLSAESGLAAVSVGTFSGSAASAPALNTAQSTWPLATVSVDATCTGVKVGSVCLGLNLGSTILNVGLGLTSADVSATPKSSLPEDVTEFKLCNSKSDPSYRPCDIELVDNDPLIYLADGIPPEPAVDGNPQTSNSSTSVGLNLGLVSTQTGSGLTGSLGGLVGNLLNGVANLQVIAGLLDLVNDLVATLVNPLLELLGIQTGTATVIMNAVEVDRPTLITTCLPGVGGTRGCPALP